MKSIRILPDTVSVDKLLGTVFPVRKVEHVFADYKMDVVSLVDESEALAIVRKVTGAEHVQFLTSSMGTEPGFAPRRLTVRIDDDGVVTHAYHG